jgi:phosphate transport system substrate-binding protein
MNTYQKKRLNNSQTYTCPQCGFDNNPLDATHCQNCDAPLRRAGKAHRILPKERQNQQTSKKSQTIPWSTVPLLGLVLVSAGLSFLWRNNAASLKKATKDNLSSDLPSQKFPETVISNTFGGLQLQDSFKQVANVPQGVFFYGGAMASAGMRSHKITNKLKQAQPQFTLAYNDPLNTPPDSGTGINMVMDGQLSFCESFRPLKQSEYELALSRGTKLKQVPVAVGGIAFYTNQNIRLPGVSLSQVQQIYRGELTNWKQLGGPNLPIVPISQDPDAKASTSFLLQGVPGSKQQFGSNVRVVRDTTSAIRMVAATPGAIGYGAQALTVNQSTIRPLGLAKGSSNNYIQPVTDSGAVNTQALVDGSYPLIRRIFIIFREDGELDELAGRAYANLLLSQEGQMLIDEAGYLPIRYQNKSASQSNLAF